MIQKLPNNSTKATGRLFVVSGPSGVGKGTLVNAVLEEHPELSLSVSATTRSPRAGDIHGVSYFFISDAEFDAILENDGMLEWAEVHGNRYGTLVKEVSNALDAGNDLILEIDPQGFEQIIKHWDITCSIFIAPPAMDELRKRLELRKSDDAESIEKRLITAQREMTKLDEYDVVIVNDDLDKSKKEIIEIVSKHLRN